MKESKELSSQGLGLRRWLQPVVIVMILTMACVSGQDIAACCDKAVGACRSVCEKMSLVEVSSSSTMREERIHNIHKFCAPHLIEFWICMNQTIQAVVLGSEWWGRSCCSLAVSGPCRAACVTSRDARGLSPPCRRSDELPLFDCVQRQQEGQWCCSLTQSLTCHEACQRALWQSNNGHIDLTLREKAIEACEQSPPLLQCLRDLTGSTVHADAARYLPCCRESPSQECRSACESVLRRTGESQLIAEGLSQACGAPVIHDALWQCFLRMDSPVDNKDLIPHDAAKLHCCHKAATINCRRSCFSTFTAGWHHNWQKFHAECLADPQEIILAQCVEEVEAPCSLGCSGLAYCNHLNDRQTSLFRSCNRQADLDAHLAVAEQRDTGRVHIAGLLLPLRNTTHCTAEVWKGIACALHVKPCTPKGHSSVLCMSECMRLVSTCVDWSKAGGLTAAELCGRLSPRHTDKPCLTALDYIPTNTRSPPLLTSHEVVTSPCVNAQCNATQVCRVNRNCVHSGVCKKYSCIDGCSLGDDSPHIVPIGSWARIPMSSPTQKACFKICRCGPKGLGQCQPLPCVAVENCVTHDKTIMHGEKYYMECNPCACYLGERVCSRRACGRGASVHMSGLPCNCPPHHVPVRTRDRHYPNVCLAKCAGASDADIEFVGSGVITIGVGVTNKGAVCLPAPRSCLSNLQTHCPQHYCVNTSNCNMQPSSPVCDTDGRTHGNPCHLIMSGRRFAYWGECLQRCSGTGHVCGVNGITYLSECAAWSEFASVDYLGPCLAVGPISDKMEPKCRVDRIPCPKLIRKKCTGFTAPGACCPKCGGALRILFSKKQIDRALYGTNVSSSVINLKNLLKSLERYVQIAECVLRGYLTIEQEIFVSIESVLKDPTDLQLQVCILEAEKIADLINRESALISSDLGLSSLSYALIVHTQPTSSSDSVKASFIVVLVSVFTYICS